MQRCQIAPEHWRATLEQFSRLHAGRAAHVSTSGPPAGEHANAEALPLLGVTAGASDDPADRDTLHVMAGRPGGPHVDHVVRGPARMWVAEWNDGCSGLLEIDAEDGSTTLVRVGPQDELLADDMIVDGIPPERPA
jgi:hypothetical protein